MYECRNLKEEIKKFVKKRALNKFTRQRKEGRADYERRRTKITPKEKDRNEEDNHETLGTINLIAGGPKSQRDEWKRGRQAYQEANIMAVEALSQNPINFESKAGNKVSSLHS